MFQDAITRELITALGIGLLIGVVRERRQAPNTMGAGIRTHALIALLGAISWYLGMVPFIITLSIVGLFTLLSYFFTAPKDPGLTGEVTIILTFILSAYVHYNLPVATGLGVLCAILVQAKDFLHRLTREFISEQELSDGLLLLASAVIVMPILPEDPIDRLGAIKLTTIWKIVLLVMASGMLGHIAQRTLGARFGLPIAGFFSGFASSTAATASFGQKAKMEENLLFPAVASTLLANLASLILFMVVVGTVSPKLLSVMLMPFILGIICLIIYSGIMLIKFNTPKDDSNQTSGKIFKLTHALSIAILIAGVSFLAAWINESFGNMSALATCILVAMAEIHAAATTLSQLTENQSLSITMAQWGVLGILTSSIVSKVILALLSGGKKFAFLVGIGLGLMLIATFLGIIL